MSIDARTVEARRDPSWFDRVDSVVDEVIHYGLYEGEKHTLLASSRTPEVWVRENSSGMLVAYSSTEADRLASIGEFVADYLV